MGKKEPRKRSYLVTLGDENIAAPPQQPQDHLVMFPKTITNHELRLRKREKERKTKDSSEGQKARRRIAKRSA
jgi:hypothetical protein